MTPDEDRPTPESAQRTLLHLSQLRHDGPTSCQLCADFAADLQGQITDNEDHFATAVLWHHHLGPSRQGDAYGAGWDDYLQMLRAEAGEAIDTVAQRVNNERPHEADAALAALRVQFYQAAATHACAHVDPTAPALNSTQEAPLCPPSTPTTSSA